MQFKVKYLARWVTAGQSERERERMMVLNIILSARVTLLSQNYTDDSPKKLLQIKH